MNDHSRVLAALDNGCTTALDVAEATGQPVRAVRAQLEVHEAEGRIARWIDAGPNGKTGPVVRWRRVTP